MKFSVSNLGRIPSAEFDIKPLTVFIGKANTNKTWTAYALYGLLRSMARYSRSTTPAQQQLAQCSQLDNAIEKVTLEATEKLLDFLANLSAEDQQFSVEVNRAQIFQAAHPIGTDIHLTLKNEDIAAVLAVDTAVLRDAAASLSMPTQQFIESGKLRSIVILWTKQYWTIAGISVSGQPIQRFVFANPPDKDPRDHYASQIRLAVRWLAMACFEDIMAFPAERKGLSGLVGLVDLPQKSGGVLNTPALEFLRFLFFSQRAPSRVSSDSKVIKLLEENVMNGRADFLGAVQMNASASFVRSMAGLDLYLRTVPNNDVIVIDEPEMNAHPEAQLKLVEFFAILANQGRHVIVTTHSPYFVDHLNNLMQGFNLTVDNKARFAESLKLRDGDAFISADKVSAHLFQENGAVANLVSDGTINLESFAAESDYVANLGRDIAEAESEHRDGAQ